MSSSTGAGPGNPHAVALRRGRRPGQGDTRADIVDAARRCFAEVGYDRASLRGIARLAGVDAALVHHYFDGKPALFVELLQLARDPRQVLDEVSRSAGQPGQGAILVRAFLGLWEPRPDGPKAPFLTAVQAVAGSPAAADGLREFFLDRVWSHAGAHHRPEERALRRALVASQLFGVAWNRYLLRLEPFASATMDDVAQWVGPTLDRYLSGPLPAKGYRQGE